APRSRRLAKDRDAVRIAAKRGDVSLHPFERGNLIERAVIARGMIRGFSRERGMREVPKGAEPIVDGHYHDAFFREAGPIVRRDRAGASDQGAPVHPYHHRTFFPALRGRPDVQIETIFARCFGWFVKHRGCGVRSLFAAGPGRVGFLHSGPRNHRLGRFPTQVTDRWRRKWDALEGSDAIGGSSRKESTVDFDRGVTLSERQISRRRSKSD